jgi:hypothetical protein
MDNHMPEKDPLSYTLVTYAWVFALALLGGCAGYVRKIRAGHIIRFSLGELVGELVVSAFVGVVTFYLCEYAQIPHVLSAGIIGISSHMGSRAIFMLETVVERSFQRFFSGRLP